MIFFTPYSLYSSALIALYYSALHCLYRSTEHTGKSTHLTRVNREVTCVGVEENQKLGCKAGSGGKSITFKECTCMLLYVTGSGERALKSLL